VKKEQPIGCSFCCIVRVTKMGIIGRMGLMGRISLMGLMGRMGLMGIMGTMGRKDLMEVINGRKGPGVSRKKSKIGL
jgi:hypothetical protein